MNRYLLIGDKIIIDSISRVLGLFAETYDFTGIYSNEFTDSGDLLGKLEKYKGEKSLTGIILTEPDCINLVKHIRLTGDLENLSLLPLIVLSSEPIEHLLKKSTDNIFMLSPKCLHIHISECLAELLRAIDKPPASFESKEQMQEQIKEFVVWSKEDEITSTHDNLNKYGALKLIKETSDKIPDSLSIELDRMSKKLWFKKSRFMESLKRGESAFSSFDEGLFNQIISNKNFLYIDDEHRLGWSFALYSFISGKMDFADYPAFQKPDRIITSADGKITCIDNFDDAVKIFFSYQEKLSGAIEKYSQTEDSNNKLTEQFSSIQRNFKEKEDRYLKAKKNFEQYQAGAMDAESRLKDIRGRLKKSIDALADTYTRITGDVEIPDILPDIERISSSYNQYQNEQSSYHKYKDDLNRSKAQLDECRKEYELLEKSYKEIEISKKEAQLRYEKALKEVSSPRKLFPYDLVILDLRLEKEKDKKAMIHDISGIRLLRQIKEIDPSLPVIVFTASEKALNYKETIDLGASGYWIKGVSAVPDLKYEILKSLSKANEARELWLGIKKVEAKKQIYYFYENQQTRSFEISIMSESVKNDVVSLLKESFLLFLRESSPFERCVNNYTNYAKIALNMGLIQEERYKLKYEQWDNWIRQRKLDNEETKIRQYRVKAAHRKESAVTYEEVLESFRLTLARCLKRQVISV